MNWKPISQESLEGIVSNALAAASPEERALFTQVAVTPTKWQLSPWGDFGGGFWVVAVMDDRVLWYNDIEDGFNVSLFTVRGVIPTTEYSGGNSGKRYMFSRISPSKRSFGR